MRAKIFCKISEENSDCNRELEQEINTFFGDREVYMHSITQSESSVINPKTGKVIWSLTITVFYQENAG